MSISRVSNFALIGAPLPVPASTQSLNLIHATQPLVDAEAKDKAQFAKMLSAVVPENWPPDVVTPPEQSDDDPWHNYYLIQPAQSGSPAILAGIAGVRIWAAQHRTVQVGCAFLPEFRGQRLGQEVVESLGLWAITQEGIDRAICDVPPDHIPSQKSLERAGYSRSAETQPSAFIRFELFKSK